MKLIDKVKKVLKSGRHSSKGERKLNHLAKKAKDVLHKRWSK